MDPSTVTTTANGLGIIGSSIISSLTNIYITKSSQRFQAHQAELNQEFQLKRDAASNEYSWKNIEAQIASQEKLAIDARLFNLEENTQNRHLQWMLALIQQQERVEEGEKNRSFQHNENEKSRQLQMALQEINWIRQYWPLRMEPISFLRACALEQFSPLRVILSPATVQYDAQGHQEHPYIKVEGAVTEKLRGFVAQHYVQQRRTRPVELLDGAWDTARFHGGASIRNIFNVLRNIPVLLIESRINGDSIDLYVGYWGANYQQYSYLPVVSINSQHLLSDIARQQAQDWNESGVAHIGDIIQQCPQIAQAIEVHHLNSLIREAEERVRQQGGSLEALQLYREYRFTPSILSQFGGVLARYHVILLGWFADLHHLVNNMAEPVLPKLLPSLLSEYDAQLRVIIVQQYKSAYHHLIEQEHGYSLILKLQFAKVLMYLGEKSEAEQEGTASLRMLCQHLKESPEGSRERLLERICSRADTDALPMLARLRDVYSVLQETKVVQQIDDSIKRLR